MIAVVAVTGAGTVVLLNKGVRDKLLGREGDQAQAGGTQGVSAASAQAESPQGA